MTAIPSKPSFTDSGVTEGEFKTALTQLLDYLTGLLGSAGTQAAAQVALGALAGAGVLVRSSAYTLVATDRGRVVSCTGTWTLGLTTASTLGTGFAFLVANTGSGTITIDPAGSETINGQLTYTVGAGATVLVMAVASNAWVVAGVALSDSISSDSSTTAASSKAVKTVADLAAAGGVALLASGAISSATTYLELALDDWPEYDDFEVFWTDFFSGTSSARLSVQVEAGGSWRTSSYDGDLGSAVRLSADFNPNNAVPEHGVFRISDTANGSRRKMISGLSAGSAVYQPRGYWTGGNSAITKIRFWGGGSNNISRLKWTLYGRRK